MMVDIQNQFQGPGIKHADSLSHCHGLVRHINIKSENTCCRKSPFHFVLTSLFSIKKMVVGGKKPFLKKI